MNGGNPSRLVISDPDSPRGFQTNNHVAAHEVFIHGDGAFPSCNDCGDRVYFTLVRAGEDIASSPYFRRPVASPNRMGAATRS
jgi:hypothetical protein